MSEFVNLLHFKGKNKIIPPVHWSVKYNSFGDTFGPRAIFNTSNNKDYGGVRIIPFD